LKAAAQALDAIGAFLTEGWGAQPDEDLTRTHEGRVALVFGAGQGIGQAFPSTCPTITKTARTLDWERERRGAELAALPLVACFPRIAWAGCTTVMIGQA
jgi:hypothetical protein